jgi:hypothetical protein
MHLIETIMDAVVSVEMDIVVWEELKGGRFLLHDYMDMFW